MSAIRLLLRKLRRDESGATAIEYGLIVALVAIAAIGGFQALGGGSSGLWGTILTRVSAAMTF